jgi:uncharacterized protein
VRGVDALLAAAARGQTKVMALLLRKGADATVTDKSGRNALMWAARNGHTGAVKMLLAEGVNPGLKDAEGKTAAALAKESKKVKVEELLKQAAPPVS